jgi:DeoR/GlpR family transcriptional regulator of sugar metabolism
MKRDLETLISQSVLQHGSRKVADLALDAGVSEVTVRKILDILEKRGLVRRFHGEARAYDGDDIPFRMGVRYAEKCRVANMAADLVESGDTILLEAGSTVAILAERLKSERKLTVVTPNLFIARIFRGSKVRVIVLGGFYQEESESLVGPLARKALLETGFSKAFIGVTGYTAELGFTLNDYQRADITQAILARGGRNFILTDSSKFGASHVAAIKSEEGRIEAVLTDPGIPDEYRRSLESAGIKVCC